MNGNLYKCICTTKTSFHSGNCVKNNVVFRWNEWKHENPLQAKDTKFEEWFSCMLDTTPIIDDSDEEFTENEETQHSEPEEASHSKFEEVREHSMEQENKPRNELKKSVANFKKIKN